MQFRVSKSRTNILHEFAPRAHRAGTVASNSHYAVPGIGIYEAARAAKGQAAASPKPAPVVQTAKAKATEITPTPLKVPTEPVAAAKFEWARMSADEQNRWIDQATFVTVRSGELKRAADKAAAASSPLPMTRAAAQAKAEMEWDHNMTAAQKEKWADRETYIAYRFRELM